MICDAIFNLAHAPDLKSETAMLLPFLAFVIGICAGLYFGFLVMVPLAAAGACTFICLTTVLGLSVTELLELMVLAAIALQGGYMLGVTARGGYATLMGRLSIGHPWRT